MNVHFVVTTLQGDHSPDTVTVRTFPRLPWHS